MTTPDPAPVLPLRRESKVDEWTIALTIVPSLASVRVRALQTAASLTGANILQCFVGSDGKSLGIMQAGSKLRDFARNAVQSSDREAYRFLADANGPYSSAATRVLEVLSALSSQQYRDKSLGFTGGGGPKGDFETLKFWSLKTFGDLGAALSGFVLASAEPNQRQDPTTGS